MKVNWMLLGALVLASPLAAGCAMDGASSEESSVGTVKLALEGTSQSGTVYRLIDAEFVITGPSTQTILPPDEAANYLLDLPAGVYQIELASGWSLVEVAAGGVLIPVEAELTSPNPQPFVIANGTTTPVQFAFMTDEPIVLGEGTLDLSIVVSEDTSVVLGDFEGAIAAVDIPGDWFRAAPDGGELQLLSSQSPQGTGYIRASFPQPDWGIIGFGAAVPFEVSGYSTLSFFYRGSQPIKVGLQTRETLPPESGGTCTTACYDAFSFVLPEESGWTEVSVPLSALAQQGWGAVAPSGLTQVLVVQFDITGPAAFDIDHVRFE